VLLVTMTQLDHEATAIYDRQIRIWGMDVQRRLVGASVLVLGCTPLAAEVCKNCVLAGIGNMTLIDDTPATEVPMTFLTMHGQGVKQATAAAVFADGLSEMNPMVKVTAAGGRALDLPSDEELRRHALVIAFGLHAGQQHVLNQACRNQGVGMLAAVSQGPSAYAFADLLRHEFAETVTKLDGSEESVARAYEYVPLKEATEQPLSSLSRHERRQLNRFAGAWAAMARLEIAEGRRADVEDIDALCAAADKRLEAEQLPAKERQRVWDASALREFLVAYPSVGSRSPTTGAGEWRRVAAGHACEFAPVNAVLGGLLANDVIRIVSRVGVPTHNLLFFSMVDSLAQVHNFTGKSCD
jgi:ubiquitin-like 1-activating enzyme E1 A